MSKHLITFEVDDVTAHHGKLSPQEIRDYAGTFGSTAGDQWDYPPYTRIVSVKPAEAEAGAMNRSDGLGADELRDHALNQIQTIAHDGVLLVEGALDKRRGSYALSMAQTDDLIKAAEAKLQRIVNIAEAQVPDEDWRPAMIDTADGLGADPRVVDPIDDHESAHAGEVAETMPVDVVARLSGAVVDAIWNAQGDAAEAAPIPTDERSPGQVTADEMADECGYKENPGEGEDDGGVDALIDYKNACEGRMIGMIDQHEALVERFRDTSRHEFNGQEVADILRSV